MIFFANPYLQYLENKNEIKKNIDKFLKKGVYILGNDVINFEKEFSNYIGTKYSLGVNSGTDAILVSLKALNIGIGDEVITTSHTAIATVSAIISSGAKPVLVDIDEDNYNINHSYIIKSITKKTKAIIVVHIYGNPVNIKEIISIGKKYKIPIIEDCAQATGATFDNKKVGSFGTFGCFSFYPTKNLGALGDGGLVTTSNKQLAKKVNRIRQYGWNKKRDIAYIGFNSRLDEIHANILSVKLKYLDEDNNRRKKLAKYYLQNLNPKKFKLPKTSENSEHVYHLFVVQTKKRNQLIRRLKDKKIYLGIHYKKAVHQEKAYAKFCKIPKGGLKNTDKIIPKIVSLPMYPQLKFKEIKHICRILNEE